jgi:sulfoxide reductase heme-binding subunit YedZ
MDNAAAQRSAVTSGDAWSWLGPGGLALVAAGMFGLATGAAVAGVSLSPLTWYLARASGFTLYLLFWLSVVSGLATTTKLLRFLDERGGSWTMHHAATELGFVMLGLHVMSLALDPSVPLGILGVLVPFTSDVRQPWTDLGIVTGYGMIALAASFGMRHLIGQRGWRLLHYSAFPLWLLGLAHGVGAGSDSGRLWAIGLYLMTTAVVMFLSVYRLLRVGRRGRPVPLPPALADRAAARRRVEEYRERCVS